MRTLRGYHRSVPSRFELLVDIVVAVGILAIVVALSVTPPPW